jgi:prophage antirepressor-like protein
MNVPSVFNFNAVSIRTFADDLGEPWFNANDICNVLGYANSRDALSKHCRSGGVAKRDTPTESGIQEMSFINEGNLYRLIVKSRKPEAEKFEQWVMEEVLPSIRKTGRFDASTSPTLSQEITSAQAQHLKELVQIITESGKQTYGETWARFQRKFSVNSYLRLPASQFDAACEYLRGKVDAPSIAVIAQKHFPQLALPGETTQLPVLNTEEIEAFATERLRHSRFIVSFTADGSIAMRSIPHDASIATDEQFVKMVANPSQFSRHLLAPLIQSAANRLVA